MMYLKYNTGSQTRMIGPFLDATDGVTEETGEGGNATEISKNGAAFGAGPVLGTHDAEGYYPVTFTAAQTGTVGPLRLKSHDNTTHLPVWEDFWVLEQAVYDALFGTSAKGPLLATVAGRELFVGADNRADVNVVEISGDSNAADNLEATYNGTGYSNDAAPATQSQVGNLTSGTAAINTTAESFTKAGAEPETNTYTSTVAEDGTYHIVEDDATSTDCYYQFDVGGDGVPVSVTWIGYAQGATHTHDIYAYNYGTTSYEQIGSISASAGTTPQTETFVLTTAHVGTGANLGKVRFRFLSSNGTAFATDRLICSFAVVVSGSGFVNGAVWVDTVNGESGTTSNIGTISRPVDNIADAKTIADNNNLHTFHIASASSINLAAVPASYDGYEFQGTGYTVALGAQSVSGTIFEGATVTGNDDGGNAVATSYIRCTMGTNSLGLHRLEECGLSGTITITETGTYDWVTCHSRVAGTGTPAVDVGSAVVDTNLNMRRYSGGIEVQNMGVTGTDKMSLEGHGQIVLAASCTGGEISIRGHFTVTDNAAAAVTLNDDARYDVTQVGTFMDIDNGVAYESLTTREMLGAMSSVILGTITDSQTANESFAFGSFTVDIDVDVNGNRTSVAIGTP
jgi:hypothetical protein